GVYGAREAQGDCFHAADVEPDLEGREDRGFHDHECPPALEERRPLERLLRVAPIAEVLTRRRGDTATRRSPCLRVSESLLLPVSPSPCRFRNQGLFSRSHEPKQLSPLLLLRPALRWEGRSGDGLSACIDHVAPKTGFLKPAINPRRIGGRFFISSR